MIQVPVEFLTNPPQPDADIHRMLSLYGPMTTRQICERSQGLADYVVRNALVRLCRHGLATKARGNATPWRVTNGLPKHRVKFLRYIHGWGLKDGFLLRKVA